MGPIIGCRSSGHRDLQPVCAAPRVPCTSTLVVDIDRDLYLRAHVYVMPEPAQCSQKNIGRDQFDLHPVPGIPVLVMTWDPSLLALSLWAFNIKFTMFNI